MTSSRKNVAFAALALLILAALFLVLSPGDEADAPARPPAAAAPTQEPTTDQVAVSTPATATPKPAVPPFSKLRSGSVRKIKVDQGDTIRLEAKSAGDEELHVHGYDLSRELPAGKAVRLSFKADLTGVFEVEFERSAEPIAEITVEP